MDVRFSIDDGHPKDLIIADMLKKKGFKGIFYVPSEVKTISDKDLKKISKDHEIGGHTKHHLRLSYLPVELQAMEIAEGKRELEELTGQKITKFSYPRGWYTQLTKDIVKSLGFEEARTMKLGVVNINNCDPYELPATAHLRPRDEYSTGIVNGVMDLYNSAKKEKYGYFNLVMHSWEIEKYRNWENLKKIIDYIYADQGTRN